MPFPFVVILELFCLISSILFLTDKIAGWWRYFIGFLLLTVSIETIAYLMVSSSPSTKSNHWLHNLFLPVEILCIGYALNKICESYFNSKLWLFTGLGAFSSLYLYESINSNFKEYSFAANATASFWIALVCCLYYYYLLKQDEYIAITKDVSFWIISGCFLFYFGTTACNLFYFYLQHINVEQNKPVRLIIFSVLNFILYSCWSYAFLCKYRKIILSK
jgi:hypothetical protein